MRYLIAAAVLGLAGSSFADIINVPSDQPTIAAAISASVNGDVIAIAAGTYYEHSLNPSGKAITIGSASGNLDVTIDAQQGGSVFVINSGEGDGTLIKDLVITGGLASFNGGGIYCTDSSPTISGCTISGNTTNTGAGGIYCGNSNPTLIECTISGNTANDDGGGIYCQASDPTFTECTISGNTAGDDGGGIWCNSSDPTLSGCTISENSANDGGGGIYCTTTSSNPTLIDTNVCGNDADQIYGPWTDGGGVCLAFGCEDSDGDGIPDKCQGSTGDGIHEVPSEYATIQEAIEAAGYGDTVLVGPGVYTSSGNWVINPGGKPITIQSTDGPEVTILDGEGVRRVVQCGDGESDSTVISGFTITGGSASSGGGISCSHSSPTITNCTIEGNIAGWGGGIYCSYSSPTIANCTISGNTATNYNGGGISCGYLSNPTLIDTNVCGNDSDQIYGPWTDGGGTCIAFSCEDGDGDGVPDKCQGSIGDGIHEVPSEYATIQEAIEAAGYGDTVLVGPGVYTSSGNWVINPGGKPITIQSTDGPEVTILDGEGVRRVVQCGDGESASTDISGFTITGGYASGAGGIYCYYSSPTIANCTISGNTATNYNGGGIYCYHCSPTITNCTIEGNTANGWGGGIHCSYFSSPTITNCTILGNTATSGGGISCLSNSQVRPAISNCTISNNTADSGGGIYSSGGSNPTLTDTLLCSNTPDQIFGDWTDAGWTLVWDDCSDCNSNGIDDAQDILDGTVTDVDNDGIPDACETDCDGDGTPDPIEIYFGDADDVDFDGHPDNCEPDCNENAIPDDYEIEQGWAEDCNDNLVPDDCDLEDPLFDCNGDGILDACQAQDPEVDCDGNGLIDVCEIAADPVLDCNGDGLIDACQELDDALDCDGNGLIDTCEIDADPSLDCNASDTLDSCDVDSGSSDDINADGIPDECQCLADIDESGSVDVNDVLLVISQWGLIDGSADVNEDGIVNVSDLLAILSAWGPCP